MKVKVRYFDYKKYEEVWEIYSNSKLTPLRHPRDYSFSEYTHEIEIETESFIINPIENSQSRFDQLIEIDGDYLYRDKYFKENTYYSHINTLRLANEYYIKWLGWELITFTDRFFSSIERDLKLKSIL